MLKKNQAVIRVIDVTALNSDKLTGRPLLVSLEFLFARYKSERIASTRNERHIKIISNRSFIQYYIPCPEVTLYIPLKISYRMDCMSTLRLRERSIKIV